MLFFSGFRPDQPASCFALHGGIERIEGGRVWGQFVGDLGKIMAEDWMLNQGPFEGLKT